MERTMSKELAAFIARLEQERIDEQQERGALSGPEKQIFLKLWSRERVLQQLVKQAA